MRRSGNRGGAATKQRFVEEVRREETTDYRRVVRRRTGSGSGSRSGSDTASAALLLKGAET